MKESDIMLFILQYYDLIRNKMISPFQYEVLFHIRAGFYPTNSRTLANYFNTSVNSMNNILNTLYRKGYLKIKVSKHETGGIEYIYTPKL